jgi:hypothetical protein
MLEWLKATVTDQSPTVAILDRPEAPAHRGLVRDVKRDLARDGLAGI